MNKNSIVFFHPKNDYTGSTRVLANIILDDYSEEKEVVIVTKSYNKGFLSEIANVRIVPIPQFRVPKIGQLLSEIILFIIAIRLSFKAKVFYINTIMPYPAMIAGYLTRRDVICHVHEYIIVKRFRTNISCWCVEQIPMTILFVSNYVKEKYSLNKRAKSEIRYNKLSRDYLSKVKLRPLDQRERNSILLIASLTEAKGLFNYVELAKMLPNLTFNLLLSADKEMITQFFTGVVIPANCNLFTATNDIHPYMHSADLIVNMSIPYMATETFGLTILEAMPYGIPAIVPNAGGPLELIEDGVNGFIVDVTDLSLLKDRIEYIFDSKHYPQFVGGTLMIYNSKFA